jgi:hypothetical protein
MASLSKRVAAGACQQMKSNDEIIEIVGGKAWTATLLIAC